MVQIHKGGKIRYVTWEEAYVPWENYRLDQMDNIWNSASTVAEICDWAAENLTGRYELTMGIGYFELEEDMVMFTLRWM